MAGLRCANERIRYDDADGGGVVSGVGTIAIAGFGMVAQRFLEAAVEHGLHLRYRLVVIGEESRLAYDRVHLSSYIETGDAESLSLTSSAWLAEHGIEVRCGTRVRSIDSAHRSITLDDGSLIEYAHLVLATGSSPFVPPVDGCDAPGVFVYRTVDDLDAIRAGVASATRAVVIGGGLLGLEAANALRLLDVETHVVEMAPRLMPVQLDDGGARMLQREIEGLGIVVHTGVALTAVTTAGDSTVSGVSFRDGGSIAAEVVVFSAGIRPRDELARDAGLVMGERGGVEIDDACVTSDPFITAIGEVACHAGRVHGLVAPGYSMAEVAAARLAGLAGCFEPALGATKLKLVGVDVASFGDAHATTQGCDELVYSDPSSGRYQKLVVDGGGAVIGGVLVGDVSALTTLAAMASGAMRTPANPMSLITPTTDGGSSRLTPDELPDEVIICSCHNVTKGAVCSAIRDGDIESVGPLKAATKAGTGCGSCVATLDQLVKCELRRAGKVVSDALCEHFGQSRQALFDIVRVRGITSFSELIGAHGRGTGCEICKPAVASMLATLGGGYILDGEQAALQDTNDHHLANIQRDGTYSVVPRIPGGEITPEKLIVIGQVAQEFDLYTKITGGQRIDLFGARVDQLPRIWERLVAAGFESGHAYGKALRTVKSCVGSTWCRYGVQDSVGLAGRLELRYRGLRAPHKLKMAVSGCARECAEAQSKDVGVIATDRGYNLYVAGNGGMRPQHAVLLAEDLDEDTLIRYVDRFLAYYIRTADRLERTAPWFNRLDGGLDYLHGVIADDALGIAAELESMIERHVDRYECEWAATLSDPARVARFDAFVNTDEPDPSLVFIRERGQRRPAPLIKERVVAPARSSR